MPARWRVERTQSPRFPFRIAIEQDGRLLFAVRAQSEWPPPGGQIFCLRERYPWRFPGAHVTRRELPVGDYALLREGAIVAVAERKSLENLLSDIGAIRALHQGMAELARQPRAAVVIEAQYGDLLDPSRTGAWPPHHVARVAAELAALHPRLPFVFAGSRKLANVWTERWFAAVAADLAAQQPLFVSDVLARYEPAEGAARAGLDERIRRAALAEVASPFRVGDLRALVPDADASRVARVLRALRREGRLRLEGTRSAARWSRTGAGGGHG